MSRWNEPPRRARPWMMESTALLCFALAAGSSCRCPSSSELNDARRMPKPPPVAASKEVAALMASLHIPAQLGGKTVGELNGTLLSKTAPDFADAERRVWRFDRLLDGLMQRAPSGQAVSVAVTNEQNVTVTLASAPRASADAPALIPSLLLTRRGEVVALLIDPNDPFPAYHGRGGQLGRQGDPQPHVAGVKQVQFTVAPSEETGGGDAAPSNLPTIQVLRNGQPIATWTTEQLAKVPTVTFKSDGGGERAGWSLRDLVHKLVGPEARLIAAVGEGDKRIAIAEADWKNEAFVPLVRLNRHNLFKLQWLDANGEHADGDDPEGRQDLRAVRRLELAP